MTYARLRPVCDASNRGLAEFGSNPKTPEKDAENRADCPVCGKRVKLYKASLERWPNTIPRHHVSAKAPAAGTAPSLDDLTELVRSLGHSTRRQSVEIASAVLARWGAAAPTQEAAGAKKGGPV